MKVIFASLSAVLLGSIPGVLSAEVSFQRACIDGTFRRHCLLITDHIHIARSCAHISAPVYLQPNLRGATLVTDFEDHATELIASMPSSIKKKLKSIKKDDDLTKKEVKSAQKKIIRKWERNTEKNCVEYLSPATCGAAKKCVWTKDTCVSTKALYEDYFFDSSEDYVADEDVSFREIRRYDISKEGPEGVEEHQEGR